MRRGKIDDERGIFKVRGIDIHEGDFYGIKSVHTLSIAQSTESGKLEQLKFTSPIDRYAIILARILTFLLRPALLFRRCFA